MTLRPSHACLVPVAIAVASAASAAAQTVDGVWPTPALDRWMYPFNTTPGARATISIFGSDANVTTQFDSRDGQFLMGWTTSDRVPVGTPAAEITVHSARVVVQFATDLAVQYDPTQDPWQIFAPTSSADWQADTDPGQSIELFGVGFRNGFSSATFQEASPYAPGGSNLLQPGIRSAFAMSFDAGGTAVDVSNHPRERVEALPFAVGQCPTLTAGEFIPAYTTMQFDLNVAHPAIQAYLRSGLSAGKVLCMVSSLNFVVQQGGNFPAFFSKENALVSIGEASAARLELSLTIGPACPDADLDCNGHVDGADLGLLLSNWGGAGSGDVDQSGQVDGADLGALLSSWTG